MLANVMIDPFDINSITRVFLLNLTWYPILARNPGWPRRKYNQCTRVPVLSKKPFLMAWQIVWLIYSLFPRFKGHSMSNTQRSPDYKSTSLWIARRTELVSPHNRLRTLKVLIKCYKNHIWLFIWKFSS